MGPHRGGSVARSTETCIREGNAAIDFQVVTDDAGVAASVYKVQDFIL